VGSSAGSVLRRNRRDLLKTREDTVTPSPHVEDDVNGSSRAVPSAASSASSTLSSESTTSTTSVTWPTTTASSAPRVTTGSVPQQGGSGQTILNPVRL
jgi:cytoskeletal protein RodZ